MSSHSHEQSLFNTIIYSAIRIYTFYLSVTNLGYIYGFICFIFVLFLYEKLVLLLFDLERLGYPDRFYLNSDNSVYTIKVGGVFEVENFDEKKLRTHMIEKVLKRVRKTSAKVVSYLGDYFFSYKHLNISEEENLKIWNSQIIDITCKKSDVTKVLEDQMNIPMNIFKDQCFLFYLIKFSDSDLGVVYIKLHHSLSDGLSMVNLIGHMDDKVDIEKFPQILKKKIGLFTYIQTFLIESFLAIVFGIVKVFVLNKKDQPELFSVKEINGENYDKYTCNLSEVLSYDLARIKEYSKKNQITINEIGLGAVSYAFKKLFPKNNLISMMIPFGGKELESDISKLKLENEAGGIKIILNLTENFESTDKKSFLKNIRDSIKNAYLKKVYIVVMAFILEFLGQNFFNSIKHTAILDMVVSNVPCQEKPIYFSGSKVINTFPIANPGSYISFVTVCSYAGVLNFCVSSKKSVPINPNQVISLMKEKLDSILSN